ncbi:MAG TPA: MBL fold metallo-hydrolase [Candidatus Dormibacteraeota bacterium]|nr:MBL fold metallo-hydrolase [Candidatus Dormibacteraeota bacterium]
MSRIVFLGTGGARFVVAKQLRASGGLWFELGETRFHVDPGPGALVRALSQQPPLDPPRLDAIVLSHKHLDHSGDVNVMIEAMTHGGWRKRGALLAPADAFDQEGVVLPYVRRFVERIEHICEHGGPYLVNDVEIRASLRHRHGVETYGLHFTRDGTTISYLPCTRYFDGLAEDYARHRPSVLILNVLRYRDALDVDHLTFDDARSIIHAVRPRVAILTHFGTQMLERKPWLLARELEQALGLRVYAARDGWEFAVEEELEAAHV